MYNFKKRKSLYLTILLVLGMLSSLFLVYEHFSPSSSTFCNFGKSFDCGIVNKSPYANLDGFFYLLTIDFEVNIPTFYLSDVNWFFDLLTSNAFLGFITLLFMSFLVFAYDKSKGFLWVKETKVLSWLKALSLFGVIYGAYLIFVQHFLLKSYCIFCLFLDVILVSIMIIIWSIKGR
jgi:uncharacterized membrane protein